MTRTRECGAISNEVKLPRSESRKNQDEIYIFSIVQIRELNI